MRWAIAITMLAELTLATVGCSDKTERRNKPESQQSQSATSPEKAAALALQAREAVPESPSFPIRNRIELTLAPIDVAVKALKEDPEPNRHVLLSDAQLCHPAVQKALVQGATRLTVEVLATTGHKGALWPCLKAVHQPLVSLQLPTTATDADLKFIGGVNGLEVLSLWETTVTDTGLAHLAPLKNLHTLNLGNAYGLTHQNKTTFTPTPITDAGLAHIAAMPALKTLALCDVKITDAGLTHIAQSKSLQHLDLMRTPITDAGLTTLTSMRKLRSLNLFGTAITDRGIETIATIQTLRDLNIGGTTVTDAGLKPLGTLKALRTLSLSQTTGIGDAGLANLAPLQSLEELWIHGTPITDAGLVHLTALKGLKVLSIQGDHLTDAAIPHLVRLTWLKKLDLDGPKLTDAAWNTLWDKLPHVEIRR